MKIPVKTAKLGYTLMNLEESFPKRYEPRTIEPKWQKFWYEKKLYSFDEKSPKPVYSIDTPPPTVSGRLHIGHAFSYTHTEITSRYRRMQGLNVYYPFGYDDNGLPTEILTEKDLGIKSYQTDRAKFRQLCLETGAKYSQAFRSLWQQLGFSCDFDSAYSTISPSSQKISQWSFIDLYQKGHLERRKEPALWCTNCATSFAQAEIDDENIAGQYLHLPFEVAGMPPLVIATTRAELLGACVSVFVHPDDDRFKKYHGKKAKVPFYEHEVPILADEKAQMDKGTGAVMCCTFGDTTDIQWWRQHKLPLREAISKIGKMTDLAGPLSGLKISAAKDKMKELLKEKNLILKTVDIPAEQRVVNTHERCGTPVEFLVQPQWFVKLVNQKDKLIEIGRQVQWHPESMRYRYENWVQNLSWDWGVSRQRSFGVPVPAWYASEDETIIHVPSLTELPTDPTLQQPKVPCPKGEWIGDPDVLDTWATSSVTPLINARFTFPNERPNFLPMSMRPQAHDIIRTWAFYTISKSYLHFGKIPWKEAVICGHAQKPGTQVQGSQMAGQTFVKKTKISKSKDGDAYAPEKILERHSADAIRLWSAAASLGVDVMFDESGISDASKLLNKLWNASRFALLQLQGFSPDKAKGLTFRNSCDLYTRGRLKEIILNYHENFQKYENHKARIELDKFFWETCDDFIELVKYRCQAEHRAEDKLEAQATLYETIFSFLLLYAPLTPHITEEIYQIYFRQFEKAESIHLLRQPISSDLTEAEKKAIDHWTAPAGGREALTLVRRLKKDSGIAYRTKLESLKIWVANEDQQKRISSFQADLAGFAFATTISVGIGKPAAPNSEALHFSLQQGDLGISASVDPVSWREQAEKKASGS